MPRLLSNAITMHDRFEEKIRTLSKILGFAFRKIALLQAAITHRSIGETNNERLEFLGDSVLNFVIAAELFKRFPKADEGELTRLRALLVRGETVAIVARELKIGQYLHLGPGEQKNGGYQRESILADALEAIIGAMYLDANIEDCGRCVLSWYQGHLDALVPGTAQKDAKTRLQEYCQARHALLPEYRVIEVVGDPHNASFHVECNLTLLKEPSIGMASTRRKAEQQAAEFALKRLHHV